MSQKFAAFLARRTVRFGGSLILILGLNQGLISCGTSKANQCRQLILITKQMAEEGAKYRDTTSTEEVLKIADAFDATATKVERLNLEDPVLANYQGELVEIYQGNGSATRNMVQALESKDILTAQLAQKQVTTIGQREQQVITNINVHCQQP
ncbi:hypothetical protein [Synechocystis sp. LEGE 06083]|uniref:hypothetical protein n=1 Tax=Synechocystis sp. LEGE 06083 TaxID=915336 RepID=UPI001D13B420|nr:hypothetical protein [Synechocystis sp. LEGE 06083]